MAGKEARKDEWRNDQLRDSLEYGRAYTDFWHLAKEHSFEKVAAIILRWAASR
jgi:hypothetical protein